MCWYGLRGVAGFGWLVGVCPLCPSDISPVNGGNPSGFVFIAALAGIGRGPVL